MNGSSLVILFIGPILWLMTSVLFMAGGISDKLICQTLQEPEKSESVLYNSINSALQQTLSENLPSSYSSNNTFKIESILQSCEDGKGLLNVFEIDVDWNKSLSDHGNISNDEIREKLIDLVNEGINVTVDKIELKTKVQNNIDKIVKDVSENIFHEEGSNFHTAMNQNVTTTLKTEEFQKVKRDLDDPNIKSIQEINNIINELAIMDNKIQNELALNLKEAKTFLREYRKSLYCNSTCDFCNSTCEVQCATNEIKVLIKDARRYINQTTRANLIEVVKDLVNRLSGLSKQ